MSSQSDTEKADLHKERHELANNPDAELEELTEIYRRRGLSDPLAAEVAKALMEHDALAAHARDEIGITEASAAQPMQAALASAASFCAGAILPLLVALTASTAIVPALAVSTLCGLPDWAMSPLNLVARLLFLPFCACVYGALRHW